MCPVLDLLHLYVVCSVFLDVFVAKDVELVNDVVVLSNSVPPASGSKLYAVAVVLEVFVFLEVLFVNPVPLTCISIFLLVFVAKDVELVNAVPLLVLVFLAVFVANVVVYAVLIVKYYLHMQY